MVIIFREFNEIGFVEQGMNETYVCFRLAQRLRDFIPVSLVTRLYKIFAKMLAERMKRVLCSSISIIQRAFVTRR